MAHLRPRTGIPSVADLTASAHQVETPVPPPSPYATRDSRSAAGDRPSRSPWPRRSVAADSWTRRRSWLRRRSRLPRRFRCRRFRSRRRSRLMRRPGPGAAAPMRASRTRRGGARVEAPAAKTDARVARREDSGLGIREQRAAMKDSKARGSARAGRDPRAAAAKRRPTATTSAGCSTGLAVPSAVVSVGYGRGCRIRRVRVPAARESQETEAVGAGHPVPAGPRRTARTAAGLASSQCSQTGAVTVAERTRRDERLSADVRARFAARSALNCGTRIAPGRAARSRARSNANEFDRGSRNLRLRTSAGGAAAATRRVHRRQHPRPRRTVDARIGGRARRLP